MQFQIFVQVLMIYCVYVRALVLAKGVEADEPKVELYMHTWYFLKSLKNDDLIVTGWANGKKGTKIVQQMHQI